MIFTLHIEVRGLAVLTLPPTLKSFAHTYALLKTINIVEDYITKLYGAA
ncbi:MAG: hypothetical protein NZ529_04020 [Cytophagaceae bacterium]|nr:hypothetical protein [Cytophagaceae bacterium]MDW8455939.1 hypothetical protein [Cytophagaceae bacterium]